MRITQLSSPLESYEENAPIVLSADGVNDSEIVRFVAKVLNGRGGLPLVFLSRDSWGILRNRLKVGLPGLKPVFGSIKQYMAKSDKVLVILDKEHVGNNPKKDLKDVAKEKGYSIVINELRKSQDLYKLDLKLNNNTITAFFVFMGIRKQIEENLLLLIKEIDRLIYQDVLNCCKIKDRDFITTPLTIQELELVKKNIWTKKVKVDGKKRIIQVLFDHRPITDAHILRAMPQLKEALDLIETDP